MAPFARTKAAIWARPRHSAAGILVTALLAIIAYPVLSTGAFGPGNGAAFTAAAAEPEARLTRSGDDLIITGSVAKLFKVAMFSGPNRAEKTDRLLITPNAITVTSSFDAIRTHLADLRNPANSVGVPGATPIVLPVGADGPRISVASLDPTIGNPALGAIDSVSPGDLAPVPERLSQQLAYARSDLPATDFTLNHDKSGKVVSDKEVWCMATAIYFEARGESYRGQVAVGQVVMNRLAHRLYPKTICGVVYQNANMRNACQFSFACDGIPETVTEPNAWAQAEEIAKGVINGSLYLTEVGAATHYHATYVYPDWAPKLTRVTKIGMHIFYKFRNA